METERNAILHGLYVDFSSLKACALALKRLGVRATEMSVLLPDGTVVTATSIDFLSRNRACGDPQSRCSRDESPSLGDLTSALLASGVPAYILERLEFKMRNGGMLLFVRCKASLLEKVEELFVEAGAEEVSYSPEKRAVIPYRNIYRKPYDTTSAHSGYVRAANA